MEVGLVEIVRSVNRSWLYDSYFSLYRPIHPGGNVRGEMSWGGNCSNTAQESRHRAFHRLHVELWTYRSLQFSVFL